MYTHIAFTVAWKKWETGLLQELEDFAEHYGIHQGAELYGYICDFPKYIKDHYDLYCIACDQRIWKCECYD